MRLNKARNRKEARRPMEGEVAGEESPNAQSHLSVTGEKSRRSRTRLEDATEGGEGSWWR